MLQLK